MIQYTFIIGLTLALVFSLIFSFGFKQRHSNIDVWMFFLIIFLTVSAAGIWLTRDGTSIWTVNWSYLFFIALMVSILLAAISGRRAKTEKKARDEIREEKQALSIINLFLLLAIAVFLGTVILNLV